MHCYKQIFNKLLSFENISPRSNSISKLLQGKISKSTILIIVALFN